MSEFKNELQSLLDDLDKAVPCDIEEQQEEKIPEGRFVQYTAIDNKIFKPVTKTQKTLPSGMYRIHHGQEGIYFAKEDFVTDELIKFNDSKSYFIVKEIEKFWTLKEKYSKYGLVHKRGFLLHGPPGGGKTSTIALVTESMINNNGLVFICQNMKSLEIAIKSVREVEKERKILVMLEDVDELLTLGQEHYLLNLLDGASQVDNVVYIATTNYPERLPERLKNRPCRFDYIVEIGYPSKEHRKIYLESKVGNSTFTDINGETYDLSSLTEGFTFAHLRDLIASVYCLELPVKDTIQRLTQMSHDNASSDKYRSPFKTIGLGSEIKGW